MRKDAQAVLLLLIGGTLLKISFAGTYVRYVKAGQLPLLLIAGVVLIVIAGVTLWQGIRGPKGHAPLEDSDGAQHTPGFKDLAAGQRELLGSEVFAEPVEVAPKLSALRDTPEPVPTLASLRESAPAEASHVTYREFTPGELVAVPVQHRVGHDRAPRAGGAHGPGARPPHQLVAADDDTDVVHGHAHGEPKIAWLLLLPALALLLFAPPALGSYQASRNGTALSAQANSDFPPLPDGDPVRISMLDYAGRAVFDQGRSLQGRRVTLSGFIIAGPNGQPYLARMIVTCCAADARPVKVGLAGDVPASLKPDEWIEVEGTYVDRSDKDPVNAELVPFIQVAAIHDIAAPKQQYES
jgi:uncharacterized repeat protein (TIGR03943 family)